jgi:glycosyltransferase involved in cell wall biosynthesis
METGTETSKGGRSGSDLVSIVIPVYNEEATLDALVARLERVLADSGIEYEIVFVDDGSRDSSAALLRAHHARNPRLKCILLSRNFGHQVAVTCGLDHAEGDAVVVMDGDLQDPPEVVPQIVAKWREGFDVVYAVRRRRKEHWAKVVAYKTFYWLMRRVSYLDIPLDSGDFSLMDRRVVDLLASMPERNRFVRGLRTWVGLNQTAFEYERDARYAGQSKYSFAKLLRLAFDGLVSYSFAPLRLVSNVGILVSLSALGYMIYLLGARIFGDVTIQGWTSTVVIVLFLGGIQLLSLGIIGEYIGRIFDEVKQRPQYVIGDRLGVGPSRRK